MNIPDYLAVLQKEESVIIQAKVRDPISKKVITAKGRAKVPNEDGSRYKNQAIQIAKVKAKNSLQRKLKGEPVPPGVTYRIVPAGERIPKSEIPPETKPKVLKKKEPERNKDVLGRSSKYMSPGSVVSAANTAAFKYFKQDMAKANSICGNQTGGQKKRCMANLKAKAYNRAKAHLISQFNTCNKTRDPEDCRQRMKAKAESFDEKISQEQAKLR
jgi:hypothetical protein